MKPERARLLAELLNEMREVDGGWIPQEAWYSVQKTFALPYVEVLIVRRRQDGQYEFLLVYRADEHFVGWEIPGGLWKTRLTVEEGCADVAQRELGIKVRFVAEVMTKKWLDHPYGYPISHVCLCEPLERIEETEHRQFFTAPPEIMTSYHHKEFMARALKFLHQQKD